MEDRSKDRQVLFKARAIASNAECFNVELGESNNPSYITAARGWTEIDNESDSDYCWVDFENHTVNTVPVPPATSVKLKSFPPPRFCFFATLSDTFDTGHAPAWNRWSLFSSDVTRFLLTREESWKKVRGNLSTSIESIDLPPAL